MLQFFSIKGHVDLSQVVSCNLVLFRCQLKLTSYFFKMTLLTFILLIISVYPSYAYMTSYSLCQSEDSWKYIDYLDKCILHPQTKFDLVTCREKIFGFSSPKQLKQAYCSLNDAMKHTLDVAFDQCIQNTNVNISEVTFQVKNDNNSACSLCLISTETDLTTRIDQCFNQTDNNNQNGETGWWAWFFSSSSPSLSPLNIWTTCKRNIFLTDDSTEALTTYCSKSYEGKEQIHNQVKTCFSNYSSSHVEFFNLLKNCSIYLF